MGRDAVAADGKEASMTDLKLAPASPRFGLHAFHAYRVAMEFYRELAPALANLRGHVVDQLRRAAESVVLNVAEAHPTFGADQKRRFRIACNEASECGAALDLLEVRG